MFNIGEVDISVYKRTDIESYMNAAQMLLNMECGTTGLVKKRKGTQFLLDVSSYFDPNSKIYEFIDKNQNTYLIMSNVTQWQAFFIDGTTGAITVVSSAITGTPYLSSDLPNIDYALDNDVLVLTHPDYPPARIYISTYNANPLLSTFSYAALQIYPMPVYDFGVVNYNQAVTTATATGTGAPGSTLTFVVSGIVFPNYTAWIGGQILSAGQNVTQPIGYAIITNVSTGGGNTTFTAIIQIPMNGVNPGLFTSIGSQYSIRQPAFDPVTPIPNPLVVGYPAKVLFYQNRLWFANTLLLPGTVFGSKINQPINFDVGTGADTDAIVYNIGQSNSGDILWMNGGKQLEIYSQNFEFAAPQEQNLALTPSTFSIRQQSAYGSSQLLKPTTYINDSYYITKNGNSIINFHFNGIGQTYTSSNISLVAQHLVKNPINRALLRGSDISQDNFIYFLNSDFSVTSFQFVTEYKLAALTQVSFNTDSRNIVKVFDVAAINNKVYFLKGYIGSLVAAIETFNDNVKMDSYFTATLATNGTVTQKAGNPPLTQLQNYFVEVTYTDSYGYVNDLGVHQIVGGVLIADNPNMFSGDVQVGLLYSVLVRPMYVLPGSTVYSSAQKETYYFKSYTRIYVDYVSSANFYVDNQLVNYQSYAQILALSLLNPPGYGIVPQTDTAIMPTQHGFNRFDTFDITQNAPFDLQITGIGYQIEANII